jgi:predicted phosphatase
MLYREIMAVCSEIRTKHINEAELLRILQAQIVPRRKHSSVYSLGGPWNSNIGALQALRFTDISLLFYIFVINHLKWEMKLKYLKTQSVPCSKHTPSRL